MKRYAGAVEAALLNLGVGSVEDLDQVEFGDLDRHLRALYLDGRARSTLAGAVAALRSFFEYSALANVVGDNAALRLRGPSTSYQKEAPFLSPAETKRLIFGNRPGWLPGDWLAARNCVLLAVSWAAGLRVSEPGRLLLDDVQADDQGRWSILVRSAKWSDQDVRIAIRDDRVARMLGFWVTSLRERYPEAAAAKQLFPAARDAQGSMGGELSARQVSRVFNAAVKEAEIEPRGRALTFHILRHTLATLCAQAGWELKAIQTLLRHKSERATLRYIHTKDERLDRLWKKKNPLARRAPAPSVVAGLESILSTG